MEIHECLKVMFGKLMTLCPLQDCSLVALILLSFSATLISFWTVTPAAHAWGGEHHVITKAAIDALSPEERSYLDPERELLISAYCGFPDINWPCYGEWGGWSGYPDEPRCPDTRREWNVSYYCQWDPVLQKGKFYPHAPPHSYEASKIFFKKSVASLRESKLADAARFLGVLLHYLQDSGSMPHVQPIHRKLHVNSVSLIRIEDYRPRVLGETEEEAAANLEKRLRGLVKFVEERTLPLREAIEEDKPEAQPAALECAKECARVCADAIRTTIAFGPKEMPPPAPPPTGVNLVRNSSFEIDDGDGIPDGWVIGWHNLKDKVGRAMRDSTRLHLSLPTHSGQYSVKLMWTPKEGIEWRQIWPEAVIVQSGEKYHCSAWMKTQDATGDSYLAIYFYRRDNNMVSSKKSGALRGTNDWQKISFEATVPEGAMKARIACRSDGNDGAVWFDDVEMIRLE